MTFAIVGGGQLDTGYTIDNSLRFNQSDDPSLIRTPSSVGNRKTFTWSGWVKRSADFGTRQVFFGAENSADTNATYIRFTDDETIQAYIDNNNVLEGNLNTSAKFRDTSAWYHIVWAVDTTQATSSDRVKVYINGSQVTSFQSPIYPAQNFDTDVNTQEPHYVGSDTTGVGNDFALDGYMAEVHFIDGQALSPTSFGEFDSDSGIWKPIQYTGTYGTNGFYLDFQDSGSLGADQSGNGNNFTPTNLASTDQTTDTPTNNFCTLNFLDTPSGSTFSEGNLKIDTSVSQEAFTRSTIGVQTGKWYFEAKITTSNVREAVGIYKTDATLTDGTARIAYYSRFGHILKGNTLITTGATFGNGDIIGTAFDLDASTVSFYKNGSLQGTVTSIDSSTWTPMFQDASDAYACGAIYNFGNPPTGFTISSGNTDDNGYGNFEYAPPSGYLALCTQNLATELSPTIDDGSQYFDTYLDTASSSNGTYNLGNLSFQPDFSWRKNRDNVESHFLFDSSRGYDETKMMSSNSTADEPAASANLVDTTVSARDGGMTVVEGSINNGEFYFNSRTYVTWNWLVNGGSTSSNTDGSITSTVQVNSTAGFSIVTYTGTGSNATVGHGLGVTPDCFVVKRRSASEGWTLYHKDTSSTPEGDHLLLNSTLATVDQADIWNDTAPTSSVFSVGINTATNGSGSTYVAYCFVEIEGYSKFGKYTGNGSSDGTFVYTGFRPAFVITKRTDSAQNWVMYDNKRNDDAPAGANVIDRLLYPNVTDAEVDTGGSLMVDFLSNGFKWRGTGPATNNGASVYIAFAENPFVTSTGIPVCAR